MASAIRKRITLATVAALGAGLLTAAPASAAAGSASGAITLESSKILRVGVTSAAFAFATGNSVSYTVSENNGTQIAAMVLSKPAGASDPTIAVTQPSSGSGSFTVNASAAGSYSVLLFNDVDPDTSGSRAGKDVDGVPGPGEAQLVVNFATAGAPTAIVLDASTLSSAAGIAKTVKVSAVDASGKPTYPVASLGEYFSLASEVSGGTATLSPTSSLVQGDFDKADGTASFTVANNTAGKTTKATVSGGGVLAGVASKSVTLTTVVASDSTAQVASLAAQANLKAGTSAGTYTAAPTVTTFNVTLSGITAGAASAFKVTRTGTATLKVDGAAYTSDTNTVIIASATGTYAFTLTVTGAANGDTITIDANGSSTDGADQVNAVITYATPAYSVSVTAPAVTPSLAITGSTVSVSGKVADQYGNPLAGATVTVTGTATPSNAAANRTKSLVVGTDGAFTITLDAADAATTSLSIVASAVKTGVTISDASAKVVTFSATGNPTSVTLTPSVGNQTSTLPYVNVPTDGTVLSTGSATVTTKVYTIADGTGEALTAGAAEVVRFTAESSPANQIVITGSAGVLFATSSTSEWTSYKATVSVASGDTVYAISTKASADNTVTATSGTTSSTFKFRTAASVAGAARNVALVAPATIDNGKVFTATVKVTDAFGNPVAGATVGVDVSGPAFINGAVLSKDVESGAAGTAIVTLVAAAAGSGDIVLKATGASAQFSASAGSGLTAASGPATSTTKLAVAKSAAELAAEKAQEEAAKAAVAVAAVQSSVTAIQTAMGILVASFNATLLVLQNNIKKVMKKLGLK